MIGRDRKHDGYGALLCLSSETHYEDLRRPPMHNLVYCDCDRCERIKATYYVLLVVIVVLLRCGAC